MTQTEQPTLPALPTPAWARDMHGETEVYTADQMREYALAAIGNPPAQQDGWNEGIEAAANICEAVSHAHKEFKDGAYQCKVEIRALLAQEPKHGN